MSQGSRGLLIVMGLILAGASSAQARELTFEERVRAQEAIERVYHSHQIGTKRPFSEAVPRRVLEDKVRAYLKQSVALREFWNTPVTGEALQRELERITGSTHLPARLREIFTALDDDPFLIQECLARPILVNRLTRGFFAADERIHGVAREEAVALRRRLENGTIQVESDDSKRQILDIVRTDRVAAGECSPRMERPVGPRSDRAECLELEPEEYKRWRARVPGIVGQVGPLTEERGAYVVRVVLEENDGRFTVASYPVPKTAWNEWWARSNFDARNMVAVAATNSMLPVPVPEQGSGWAVDSPCFPDDTWSNGTLNDIPIQRNSHAAVWTGSEMIIWGGDVEGGDGTTGARYDPATSRWSPTSTSGAPAARTTHTAVWTGSEMIVWGGSSPTGGRYDPMSDSWTPTTTLNAPQGQTFHTAVWTGSEMIVWGGNASSSDPVNTGGRYDPIADSWSPITTTGAPQPRSLHTAVWTGSEMVVWGGVDIRLAPDLYHITGGRYDPSTNTWTSTSTLNAPQGRSRSAAVWTGSEMIVWGGSLGPGIHFNTGGRYDPVSDSWTQTSTVNAPEERNSHVAVWTGDEMVVWGGLVSILDVDTPLNTGGRYDPTIDTWVSISMTNAPSPRVTTAVWADNEMIIWGGNLGSRQGQKESLNTGGRYDPATNIWVPTSTANEPEARVGHTTIWTGNEMIVWGGLGDTTVFLHSGSRYDPVTDSWTPTSTSAAPQARRQHTAVWSGSEMIIWGGFSLDTGGRYDPLTDIWVPTSTITAPQGRHFHTAVWTGSEMVVWGGLNGSSSLSTGALYEPVTDSWMLTSTTEAPSGRFFHTAVWSGSEMIIWGGIAGSSTNTGGRYDPATNIWTPTSTIGAPSARNAHSAIWTGGEMIAWGGSPFTNTGGRYDPATDGWTPMSTSNAPAARSAHFALWTGSAMIVWDGSGSAVDGTGGRYEVATDTWTPTSTTNAPLGLVLPTGIWTGNSMIVWGYRRGGQYFAGDADDGDSDGFRVCDGDCDDTSGQTFPGAPQVCDSVNNDCNDPIWPAVPSTEIDNDGDGIAECQGDCNDSSDATFPGAPQLCDGLNNDCDDLAWPVVPANESDIDGDGSLVCEGDCDDTLVTVFPGAPQICDGLNNDCNDPLWPAVPSNEFDGDMDGFALCNGECNDADACTSPGAEQVCDGANNDCSDLSWPAVSADELDDDGDGFVECGPLSTQCPGGQQTLFGGFDCDDGELATYPEAPEVNDEADNQCPGEFGFGIVDETSGNSGFHNPADLTEYSWTPQAGANRYEVQRSTLPGFSADCTGITTSQTTWSDAATPAVGGAFFYLNRPTKPKTGSWGQDSSGVERVAVCP